MLARTVLVSILAGAGLLAACSSSEPPADGGPVVADGSDQDAASSQDGAGGGQDATVASDTGIDAADGGADAAAYEPAALAGITAAHNSARATVGVGPLTWDPALAATAQAWADTCTDVNAPIGLIDVNPNRSNGHPWYVGENTYGSASMVTPSAAVSSWMAQGDDYDYASNTCAPGKLCGFYTQLVWAASTRLGCGVANCAGLAFGQTIVCNYGPGGNTGQRPY